MVFKTFHDAKQVIYNGRRLKGMGFRRTYIFPFLTAEERKKAMIGASERWAKLGGCRVGDYKR